MEELPEKNKDEDKLDNKACRVVGETSGAYFSLNKQSDQQCSICLDSFKYPKLLPCLHTFCLGCIRTYMIKTKNKNQITCPLCRQSCRVMTENLNCILNNYFVEATIGDKFSKSCDICNKLDEDVIGCIHCGVDICSECSVLHKHLSSRTEEMASEEPAGERSRYVDDISLPIHLLLSLPFVRTKVITDQLTSFLATNRGLVNSVSPQGQGQCWIIGNGGPEVVLFDVTGREIRKVDLRFNLSDALETADSSLLVAVWDTRCNRNEILKISSDGHVSTFVKYKNYNPAEISLFPDGRLVVAWVYKCESEDERIELPHGTVHIYSPEGMLLKDFGETKDLSILPYPFGVTVNPIFGFIYVTDYINRIVVVLSEEGDVIDTYGGGSTFERSFGILSRLHRRVKPVGLCCDQEGNVIVCDPANKILHLLSPTGKFLGIIMSKADDGVGSPGSVAVDDVGRIWVGGFIDGTVRVLEVKAYNNDFGSEE